MVKLKNLNMNLKNFVGLALLVISLYMLMAVYFLDNVRFYQDGYAEAFFIITAIIGIICFFIPKK
jgi:hypothetical protein